MFVISLNFIRLIFSYLIWFYVLKIALEKSNITKDGQDEILEEMDNISDVENSEDLGIKSG